MKILIRRNGRRETVFPGNYDKRGTHRNRDSMSVLSSEELKASYEYEKSSDGSITLTKYIGTAEDVVIPTYAVLRGKICSIESIGWFTFYGCGSVRTVTIPNTVRTIGMQAFRGCRSLTSVSIPASVESIDPLVFLGCDSLTEFSVDEGNTVYCAIDGTLVRRSGMELIRYPPGRGDAAYTIPDCIQAIGNSAFDGCKALTSVKIPDSVRSIGENAFYRCTSMESIAIPATVQSIGSCAFQGCSSLRGITVSENNPSYRSADGVLFDRDSKILIQYPPGRKDTSYRIPETVESVMDYAFAGCAALESIGFSDSVRNIGKEAFLGCPSLRDIGFGDAEIAIGEGAFRDCTSLVNVTVTDSVRSVEEGAFGGCTSLRSFEVTEGNGMFNAIDGVLFDRSERTVFQYPPAKTDSEFTVGNGRILDGALCGCPNLESIRVPEGHIFYRSADGVLFDLEMKKLVQYPAGKKDVEYAIPDSVEEIGVRAFSGCGNLKRIKIPDSVKKLGWYAFEDCTSLESVRIPDSVVDLGYRTFENCTSLRDVEITDREYVNEFIFEGCPVLEAGKN